MFLKDCKRSLQECIRVKMSINVCKEVYTYVNVVMECKSLLRSVNVCRGV